MARAICGHECSDAPDMKAYGLCRNCEQCGECCECPDQLNGLVVPGNWASVRGGKWHLLPPATVPQFRDSVTSLCGVTFEPWNITGGEAPPTNSSHICKRCV